MAKSFLQSRQWALFKKQSGWKFHNIQSVIGLSKQLPLGIYFLYFPEIMLPDEKLKTFVKAVRYFCVNQGFAFARLEFFEEFDEANIKDIDRANKKLQKLGLRKSPEEMQPEYRQLIDLTPPEENLLAQMKPKGRYNIKIAERHKVKIQNSKIKSQNDNAKIKIFYDLYKQSSERDGFTPRPLGYFNEMLTHMSGHMSTYVALWQGKPLAAALIVFWQGRASYLYGGSSSDNRNVMAPYLLHWNIIQDAKAAGLKTYDLLAIAPGGVAHHKFSGLRRFKEQFGGRSVRVLGSYDLIIDPLRYKLFVIAEKLRGRF
ncbi:peptidoglycan bridge formation glycyltransferase FemA/FemB family protein [Candidatus Berkelbacteria bacterium]|nr:peptidoglycan bridge formation glycyltransferase FemA/FemB family protein [Candidatus Berkelbacteria bacterium]